MATDQMAMDETLPPPVESELQSGLQAQTADALGSIIDYSKQLAANFTGIDVDNLIEEPLSINETPVQELPELDSRSVSPDSGVLTLDEAINQPDSEMKPMPDPSDAPDDSMTMAPVPSGGVRG